MNLYSSCLSLGPDLYLSIEDMFFCDLYLGCLGLE